MITENEYAYWLFNSPGLGNKKIDKLLSGGVSCKGVYFMSDSDIRMLVGGKAAEHLIKHKRCWDFELEKRKLEEAGIRFIPRISKEFPQKLKNIPDAPFAIYVKGKLPDPDKPSVAIIGARMCSDYGRYMAREFGRDLSLAGVQVISGMARGVDGISQKAAIESGGSTFGVLGCGVNVCYPEENLDVYNSICENGGLISEYAPDTLPRAQLFPMRNRIISALADVVLVVEARLKSGTQITVDQALEQGKEVLAVPGRVTDRLSDGCNYLINQGAGIATCAADVLDRLSSVCMCNGNSGKEQSGNYEVTDSLYYDENVESKGIERAILDSVDIIPISASALIDKLNNKGVNITIPELMKYLMDMVCSGQILQEGVYYRKKF